MDSSNFRKFNSSRRPASAVDGFIGSRGNLGRSPGTPARPVPAAKPAAHVPSQAPRHIGDTFRKSDGFHAVPHPGAVKPALTQKPLGRATSNRLAGVGTLEMPIAGAPAKKRGKKKKKLTRGKKILRAALIVVMVFVIGTGFLVGKGLLKTRNIFKGGGGAAALDVNVDPAKLNGEGDGRVNILMLGKGGDGHEAPDLTDTIIVASIDPIAKEASLLSIPRDLWVENENGGHSKINAVYANAKYSVLAGSRTSGIDKKAEQAGLEAIEKTIEETMGIPIHYYAMVDFTAFQQAVDAVGGVDIDVKTPVTDYMYINGRNYTLDVKTGQNHFDGFRALAYSRSRHTSLRGDFDRSQRQREVLMALKSKILTAGTFSNPKKISQLIDAFGNHVQTNMTLSEMLRLYEIGKDISGDKVASLGLADPPNVLVQTGNIDGQSVVMPKAGVDNYTAIQSFVRNALKDAFLKKEDATIAIYNGTATNGLAGTKAEELRSFGYNIATVANAPTKNYSQTIIVDMRNGQKKYTKNYLEKRFNVTAVTSMPDGSINPGNVDFVIILGNDAAN
jgi:polyisoprenyl-teichoic acid--peptidoglycan teichoic acid transferase